MHGPAALARRPLPRAPPAKFHGHLKDDALSGAPQRGRHAAGLPQAVYPSYNLTPLLYKRHQQLIDARAFNEWLAKRRERQEGEAYADELGRMTDVVNRRIPQLRWSPAERAGVRRMARDVTAGRNTSDSGVYGGMM